MSKRRHASRINLILWALFIATCVGGIFWVVG